MHKEAEAGSKKCVSIINFPLNRKDNNDSSCRTEQQIKTSLRCFQSVIER